MSVPRPPLSDPKAALDLLPFEREDPFYPRSSCRGIQRAHEFCLGGNKGVGVVCDRCHWSRDSGLISRASDSGAHFAFTLVCEGGHRRGRSGQLRPLPLSPQRAKRLSRRAASIGVPDTFGIVEADLR